MDQKDRVKFAKVGERKSSGKDKMLSAEMC